MKKARVFFIILLFSVLTYGSAKFGVLVDSGIVTVPALVDASAMASSKLQDGIVWACNGHSDNNKIYALDSQGKLVAAYYLKTKWQRNWEDMASGPGPDPAKTYLYVGDIGDNDTQWVTKSVYRFEEPLAMYRGDSVVDTIKTIDRLDYVCPDKIRNAEAMFLDPLTRDYYVISKEQNGKVYRATYPQPTSSIDTLELLDSLPFKNITAADISPSGDEILIKDYVRIYYWKRATGESFADAMKRAPARATYRMEPCGEALCWSRNADAYFTVSEERDSVDCRLYHYLRTTVSAGGSAQGGKTYSVRQSEVGAVLSINDNRPRTTTDCFDLSGRIVTTTGPMMKLLVRRTPRRDGTAFP
ncbi:MAG: hypothetical protein JW913_14090 [Chitinispirillaceae bacterium]|nr:hypothetical protein [Chitinispirillaceae bacterium]